MVLEEDCVAVLLGIVEDGIVLEMELREVFTTEEIVLELELTREVELEPVIELEPEGVVPFVPTRITRD